MKHHRNLKKAVVFLCCAVLALSAFACAPAEGEAPALKKLAADRNDVRIYADAAVPEVLTFSASPEEAQIDGLECSSNPQGVIEARRAGENRVEILPLKAGRTTLSVMSGKIRTTVKVTVLQPVTSVTLECDQLPAAGRTIRFKAVTEPKNAADKTVEWSVEAKLGAIRIDQDGSLKIPEKIAPGTEITVRCKALGTAGNVEAVRTMMTQIPLPDGFEKAVAGMKQYPLPDALQDLSTDGSGWIPADTVPVLTGIREVTLEDNVLNVVTEKDVPNIYVGELDRNESQVYTDYNSQHDREIRTKHEARVKLENPKAHKVYISVNEYVTIRGKRQMVSGQYLLKTNPLSLEPQSSNYSIDLNPKDYPPYTAKTAPHCNLQCTVWPDGRPLQAGYHFDGHESSFQINGYFDPNTGKLTECRMMRWYTGGGAELCAEVTTDGSGNLAKIDYQMPSRFIYTFTNGKDNSDIRKRAERMNSGVDLDAEGIEIWLIEFVEDMNKGWVTETFVCDEPLFIRAEDGSLALNRDLKDVKGRDFPHPYLCELMDPALFSMPRGFTGDGSR